MLIYGFASTSTHTYSPAGEWQPLLVFLLRVDHAQLCGNLPVGVRDDGVGKVTNLAVVLGKRGGKIVVGL